MKNNRYEDRLLMLDFNKESDKAQKLLNDAYYFCQRCINEIYFSGHNIFSLRIRGSMHTFTIVKSNGTSLLDKFEKPAPRILWKKLSERDIKKLITLMCVADGFIEYFINGEDYIMTQPILEVVKEFWKPSKRLINSIKSGITIMKYSKKCTVEEFISFFSSQKKFSSIPKCGTETIREMKNFLNGMNIDWKE